MAQTPMYAAMANSPGTELSADITALDTEISVLDASKLPAAPNLFTVGNDETAETILYSGKNGNILTGCTRGFNGTTAKGWSTGAKVARNFTGYDHDTFIANIEDLDGRVTTAQATADAAETPEGAQEKADTAEANAIDAAKDYTDGNFFNRDSFDYPNLIKNSGAMFDFNNWTKLSDVGTWGVAYASDVGGYFYTTGAVPSGQYAILDSDPIYVSPGADYTYSAFYMTQGIPAGGVVTTEIRDLTGGTNITSIPADNGKGWHRKSATFTIPSGVAQIGVRLVMTNVPAVIKAVSRMKLSFGDQESAYTDEADNLALFQSVSNGKNDIAAAITDKDVPASGSDTFQVLADKIGQIPTGVDVSIQRGQRTMVPDIYSNALTFSAVDLNKSIIRLMIFGSSNTFRLSHVRAELKSAVSADFTRGYSPSSDVYLFWEVIEFSGAKSVQRGTVTFYGGNAEITFSAVDPLKSLIFYSYETNDGSPLALATGYTFANNTTANLRMDVNGTNKFTWYLVEF